MVAEDLWGMGGLVSVQYYIYVIYFNDVVVGTWKPTALNVDFLFYFYVYKVHFFPLSWVHRDAKASFHLFSLLFSQQPNNGATLHSMLKLGTSGFWVFDNLKWVVKFVGPI